MKLAIFAITKNGIKFARTFFRKIDKAALFTNPVDFKQDAKLAFKKYDGLIFIMAAGIVVRTIAPLLKNKAEDPAVVVMDEKGRYVISLLSGHLGGANNLAREIAKMVGGQSVITTATDVNSLPCIEDIAEKFNLAIEDFKKIKMVNSAIVNGKAIAFIDEDVKRLQAIREFADSRIKGVRFHKSAAQALKNKIDALVVITNKWQAAPSPSPLPRGEGRQNKFPLPYGERDRVRGWMILRPRDIVIGIGCDRGVKLKEVEDSYFSVLEKWDVSPLSVRNVASIDVKKDEKGLLRFARKYNLKIDFYSKDELTDMPLPSGFSSFVMGKVGVGGVCEPAALKSAGTKKIWIRKQKIGRVTIAAAKAPFVL
ncbi:MAG: cobalt-precorrin 5A hydrolase [Deltaproteobacteria bacterium]|nr:cobalt-precorrin 5A hydrolase [Deltaproteobacteria bacterium]